VDYETLERIPKASGLWYAKVAVSNALPSRQAVSRVG
jgi:beta-glucosidase